MMSTPVTNPDGSPSPAPAPAPPPERPRNFIEQIIDADNAAKKWGVDERGVPRVHTRFPPEPNGYLHIGHAKSICLNAGLARQFDGKFNLRFDDTNPSKEDQEYVDAIKEDVKWLGADFSNPRWPGSAPGSSAGAVGMGAGAAGGGGGGGGGVFWASDYFEKMYDLAEELVKKGKAYVCDLSAEEVAKRRGNPGVPATSPFRDRPVEESLQLLREMRAGKYKDGDKTLRAKIDLASPNFNLRDPVMYRIVHAEHHNTGSRWCMYPMYDWAHGVEDSIEGITHSICTLEFENHRPLYDWFLNAINEGRTPDGSGPWGKSIAHPQQIEFAKLNLNYTILSKRNLLKMVQDRTVAGWDDPRMPTIRGMRRRGYTAEAIRAFCDEVGVTKVESVIDLGRLENAIRADLNKRANRAMAVLRPLRLVIENWADGGADDRVEELDCVNNPESPGAGTRKVPFGKTLYIERDDFMESPPKKFFRLAPGVEVRLRYAFLVTCTGVVKDPGTGEVIEVRCRYDPATRGGDAPDGRKVRGTIHWVSAQHALHAEVRLFDRLFNVEDPGKRTGNFADDLNRSSLEKISAMLEPSLGDLMVGARVQFERSGYFCVDKDSGPEFGGQGAAGSPMVWNRTVTLKDSWAKEAVKGA